MTVKGPNRKNWDVAMSDHEVLHRQCLRLYEVMETRLLNTKGVI